VTTDPLAALTDLPGVADAVAAAREACTALRWHPALRRQMAQARAEAVVRAARASAALDGAELPLSRVRELVVAQPNSPSLPAESDPVMRTVRRALRVTAAGAELGPVLMSAPAQAFARLHLAAAGEGSPDEDGVGRPRAVGIEPGDLVDLGPAPSGGELVSRLDQLSRLLTAPHHGSAVVLVAVVHGELLSLRPFPSSNGLVARAVSRGLVVETGLDPTGVAVPEIGLLARGVAQYVAAAAAYRSGAPDGMAAWIRFWANAISVGAAEGGLVADAVLAGKLPA
jgi:hypothetical protein